MNDEVIAMYMQLATGNLMLLGGEKNCYGFDGNGNPVYIDFEAKPLTGSWDDPDQPTIIEPK